MLGRQSWEVRGLFQLNIRFLKLKVASLKNICMIWSWNLQVVLELSFPLLQTEKNTVKLRCSELFWQNHFHLFFGKIPIFSFALDILRHNFVTSWPILVIEVSTVRRHPYLSIDIKTKFIKSLVAKIQGSCNNSRWLDVLQKLRWLDEGEHSSD